MVDNAIVTVFFNDAELQTCLRIIEKAELLSILLTKNGHLHTIDLLNLILGAILPNTALMIIMAGKKRYELKVPDDLSTKAKLFFYINYKKWQLILFTR